MEVEAAPPPASETPVVTGAAAEPAATEEVIAISCGSSHTVAVLSCNALASFGRGEDGQLGLGDAEDVLFPSCISTLVGRDVSSVACGAEYTVAWSAERKEVYSWGWGDFGRLGHGNCNDQFVPCPIAFFSGRSVAQVACGDTHTLACTTDGQLYAFGRNQNGQLGLGHTDDTVVPALVETLQGRRVCSIACGSEHSLIADDQGQVYGWGWGRYGNLGDGGLEDRLVPTRVIGLTGQPVREVRCGWRHSILLTTNGRLFTFGWNKYGQLGLGDISDRCVPSLIEALEGVIISTVAGGWRHTTAGTQTGRLYSFGWNKFGQLGIGDTLDRSAPTLITTPLGSSNAHVKILACGWRHTVAVTDAGHVYSWGRGVNGQLGHGAEEDVHTPKLLQSLTKGSLTRAAILATATSSSGHITPSDRYAVVPDTYGQDVPSFPSSYPNGPGFSGVPNSGPGSQLGLGLQGTSSLLHVPQAPGFDIGLLGVGGGNGSGVVPESPSKRQRTGFMS